MCGSSSASDSEGSNSGHSSPRSSRSGSPESESALQEESSGNRFDDDSKIVVSALENPRVSNERGNKGFSNNQKLAGFMEAFGEAWKSQRSGITPVGGKDDDVHSLLNAAEDKDVIFLESRSGTSGAQKCKAGPPEPVPILKQSYYGVGSDGLKANVSKVSLQSSDSKDGTYMKKDVMFGTGKPATSDKYTGKMRI